MTRWDHASSRSFRTHHECPTPPKPRTLPAHRSMSHVGRRQVIVESHYLGVVTTTTRVWSPTGHLPPVAGRRRTSEAPTYSGQRGQGDPGDCAVRRAFDLDALTQPEQPQPRGVEGPRRELDGRPVVE